MRDCYLRWWQILLLPVAIVYAAGLKAYLWWRLPRRKRVDALVISVGNIEMGGTGKTPVVIAVSRYLQQRGFRVAVLSRGYGGSLTHRGGVVSDGKSVLATCAQAGDEPVLIARQLPGVAVLVGKDRRQTAQFAIEHLGCDALVLDDGFQYWQLYRDIDLVLVDSERLFESGWALPAGFLREPPNHLERCDVLLVHGDSEALAPTWLPLLPRFSWSRQPQGLRRLHEEELLSLQYLQGRRVFLVAGIARFQSFEQVVHQLGAVIVGTWRLSDHHPYTPADVLQMQRRAERCGAEAIVTTEKDAVKLEEMPAIAQGIAIFVLQIEARLGAGFWRWMDSRIRWAKMGLSLRCAETEEAEG